MDLFALFLACILFVAVLMGGEAMYHRGNLPLAAYWLQAGILTILVCIALQLMRIADNIHTLVLALPPAP